MIYLGCNGVIAEDNNVWFSNINFNGLFKVDLNSGFVELIHKFRNLEVDKKLAHRHVFKEKSELIFMPWFDNKIIIYDLETQTESIVEVPMENGESEFLGNAFRTDGVIWLFPGYSKNKVFCYDIEKKCLMVHEKLSQVILRMTEGENVYLQYKNHEKYVTMCIPNKNIICNINLDTLKNQIIKIDNNAIEIIFAVYDGKDYWFIGRNNANIYQWNPQYDVWTEYYAGNNKKTDSWGEVFYTEHVFYDKGIIMPSFYATNITKVNKEKRIVEKAFDYPIDFKIIKERVNGPVFVEAVRYGKEICFIPYRGSQIVCYDWKKEKVRGIELAISEENIPYLEELIRKKIKKEDSILEGRVGKLKDYLNSIEIQNNDEKIQASAGAFIKERLFS